MDFYNNFACLHDIMLPINERLEFNKELYNYFIDKYNLSKVLDSACWTWVHAILLKKMGINVSWTDISEEMIKKAKKNSLDNWLNIDFEVLDFKKLHNRFWRNKFDAVLCVWNSLPHIFWKNNIYRALKSMYTVLNENWVLIMNQRNYDLMMLNKKRFGIIDRDNLIFFYVYDYFKDRIDFNIVVIDKKDSKILKEFKTSYNNLLLNDLINISETVGFNNIKLLSCDKEIKDFDINTDEYFYMILQK